MPNDFFVLTSTKVGLNSKESYVVVRNQVGFLRILGAEPEWSLMTATADEDHGRIQVCPDQRRLNESALRLGTELRTEPKVERDHQGREYVKICVITRDAGQSDAGFDTQNSWALSRFFEIYDSLPKLTGRSAGELRDLYGTLAPRDQGDDVGSLQDRGR